MTTGWQPMESDGIKIALTHGLFTEIDAADLNKVIGMKWSARPRRDGKGFYAVSTTGVRMHRLLLSAVGEVIVDHIDGNGLNNRRNNIRVGTQSQNCVNRKTTPGKFLRGTRPQKGRWRAYIKYRGKQKSLGYFDTENDAHNAYLIAAHQMHGDWMPLPAPPTGE